MVCVTSVNSTLCRGGRTTTPLVLVYSALQCEVHTPNIAGCVVTHRCGTYLVCSAHYTFYSVYSQEWVSLFVCEWQAFKPRGEPRWFKACLAYISNKPRYDYSPSGLYYDIKQHVSMDTTVPMVYGSYTLEYNCMPYATTTV